MSRSWMLIALLAALGLGSGGSRKVTIQYNYNDWPYTRAGFTGQEVARPIRDALVIAWWPSSQIYGRTDDTGTVVLTVPNNVGELNVRVYPMASDDRYRISVLSREAYGKSTFKLDPGDIETSSTFDVMYPTDQAVLFNVFETAQRAWDYLRTIEPTLGGAALAIDARDCEGISGYDDIADVIHLCPDAQWNDDTTLHEIGHWAQTHYGRSSLGMLHSLDDLIDPRSAFGEGWAHYFSSVVRAHNADTAGEANYLRSFDTQYDPDHKRLQMVDSGNADLELGTINGDNAPRTQSNEVSVASALWYARKLGTELPLWAAMRGLQSGGPLEPTLDEWFRQLYAMNTTLAKTAAGDWHDVNDATAPTPGRWEQLGITFFPDGPYAGRGSTPDGPYLMTMLNEPNDTPPTAWNLVETVDFGPGKFMPRYTMFAVGKDPSLDEDWFSVWPAYRMSVATALDITVALRRTYPTTNWRGYLDGGISLALEVYDSPCPTPNSDYISLGPMLGASDPAPDPPETIVGDATNKEPVVTFSVPSDPTFHDVFAPFCMHVLQASKHPAPMLGDYGLDLQFTPR